MFPHHTWRLLITVVPSLSPNELLASLSLGSIVRAFALCLFEVFSPSLLWPSVSLNLCLPICLTVCLSVSLPLFLFF